MAQTTVTLTQMSDARILISLGLVQEILDNEKESVSGHMKDVMEQCVRENLLQCENWTRTLLQDLLECNTAADDIRALNDHMADYLTQSFRQRNASLSLGAFPQGKPTEPHINVLKKLNYELSRHLKLEGTTLLDRLYEVDMMSESDRKSIIAKTTDRRKNEAFIEFLCSNFTTEKFKARFLPILFEDDVHIDLAERIADELEAASTTAQSIRCTFCTMKAIVNIRKLSEGLFEKGSISPSVKHDLCLSENPNSSKWELLLKNVQEEKKLLDVLEKSYEHLFREFQETEHPVLLCCCSNMKLGVAEKKDFTSSDIATTSDVSTSTLWIPENEDGTLEQVIKIEATEKTFSSTKTEVLRQTDPQDFVVLDYLEQLVSISDISKYIVKQQEVLIDLEDEYFEMELQLSTEKDSSLIPCITNRREDLLPLIEKRKYIIHETQKFKDAAKDLEKQLAELEAGCDAEKLFTTEKEAGVIWTENTETLKFLEEEYLHKSRRQFRRPCVIQ